jgi:hypothetical protein
MSAAHQQVEPDRGLQKPRETQRKSTTAQHRTARVILLQDCGLDRLLPGSRTGQVLLRHGSLADPEVLVVALASLTRRAAVACAEQQQTRSSTHSRRKVSQASAGLTAATSQQLDTLRHATTIFSVSVMLLVLWYATEVYGRGRHTVCVTFKPLPTKGAPLNMC